MRRLRIHITSEFYKIRIPDGLSEEGFIDLVKHEFSKALTKASKHGHLDIEHNGQVVAMHKQAQFTVETKES